MRTNRLFVFKCIGLLVVVFSLGTIILVFLSSSSRWPKPCCLNDRTLLSYSLKYSSAHPVMLEFKKDYDRVGSYVFVSAQEKRIASDLLKSFIPINPVGLGKIPDTEVDYSFVFTTANAGLCFRIKCEERSLLLSVSDYSIVNGVHVRNDYRYTGGNRDEFLKIIEDKIKRGKISFEKNSFILD